MTFEGSVKNLNLAPSKISVKNQPQKSEPLSAAEIDQMSGVSRNEALALLRQKELSYSPETLLESVKKGDEYATRLLLTAGINPDLREDYASLLSMALSRKYDRIAELLLRAGAPVTVSCPESERGYCSTPLLEAALSGNANMVRLLIERGAHHQLIAGVSAGRRVLLAASAGGETAVMTALITAGVDASSLTPNEFGDHLTTPLMRAAGAGEIDAVRLLLDAGADLEIRDARVNPESGETFISRTALLVAVESNYPEVVQLLLDRGADSDVTDKTGDSPLKLAITRGYTEVIEILLRHCSTCREERRDH